MCFALARTTEIGPWQTARLGVEQQISAEYLGHHDPGFTLRTYAHLMPESEDRARNAIDAALVAPAESTRNAEQG